MTLKAIVVDSREPAWCKALTFGDATVTVQELPCGDAWLATQDTTIIVERKGSLGDLTASIADNRLFGQSAAMVAASQWAYLVVTKLPTIQDGCLVINNQLSRWTWASVQGALLTVQELGVGVRWAVNDGEYKNVLKQLANRNRDNVILRRKREAVMRCAGEEILCSLPQISDGRAQALLEYCGTAADALVYLTGSGKAIPNIGPTIKASTHFALGLQTFEDGSREVLAKIIERTESNDR